MTPIVCTTRCIIISVLFQSCLDEFRIILLISVFKVVNYSTGETVLKQPPATYYRLCWSSKLPQYSDAGTVILPHTFVVPVAVVELVDPREPQGMPVWGWKLSWKTVFEKRREKLRVQVFNIQMLDEKRSGCTDREIECYRNGIIEISP
jgi:hypothetical protein